MNELIFHISMTTFFALPALLLGARLVRPRYMPWLWLLLVDVLLSWLLVNASVHFYFEHLGDELERFDENPPLELLDAWTADGAKRVFALFFGWAYGLVYLLPWLALYGVCTQAWGWIRKKRCEKSRQLS